MQTARPRPSQSELRWFGLLLAVVFGILGGVVWWQAGAQRVSVALWSLGVLLGATYYLVPPLRWPLYTVWMSLVMPIGLFISTLVLGLIYFGVITPLGRFMALFGRDKLDRRPDPDRTSYWVPHPAVGDTGRYLRQS